MEDKADKKDGVAKIWDTFLSTTSAHSLSHVPIAAGFGGRMYWYVLFLGVLAVACYQISLLVSDYLDYPVLMNIRVVNEPNLVFPSVTVCNQNRLMSSKVKNTRFQDIPDIDKAFCACRYVGGLSAQSDGKSRRKRSTAESCVDVQESGIDWTRIHHLNKKTYIERFQKEYDDMRQEMPDHSEHEVLDKLHARLLEPMKKRVKRSHVMDTTPPNSGWIDYSKVKGVNDWWGLLNSTSADNLALIGSLVRATANETKHLGHQPEDFIVQCSFDNSPCSYRDFRMFQHKRYGNCFTFNHGTLGDQLRFTSRSGTSYGLKMTLFIDQEEYIGLLTPEAGVRTIVHRPFTVPFPEDDGFDCRPGTSTTFGIRQHEIHRTKLPYGGEDCTDGIYEDRPVYDGAYSFLACTKSCIQRELLRNCGCVDDINTILTDVKICDIMIESESNCVNSVYKRFENDDLKCICNQLCNETYYSSQYSATLWPSDQHEGYLFADIATKSSKVASVLKEAHKTPKNVVRVNINYMELNKEIFTEVEKYGIWDLLSSLGGSMGLYVGMSVVTFVEFFGVLFFMLTYCLTALARKDRGITLVRSISHARGKDGYENMNNPGDLIKMRARPLRAVDLLSMKRQCRSTSVGSSEKNLPAYENEGWDTRYGTDNDFSLSDEKM
uniref:amiloride-sensitive sodium channel subunit beta-like n=1 Tax=Styela clava TaxID=7725 RepID=UPI001939BDD2|nr:amiloride-sensitive sodium channel subunit beta-like [Styela clava]